MLYHHLAVLVGLNSRAICVQRARLPHSRLRQLLTIILLLVQPTPQLIPGSRTPQPPFNPLDEKSFLCYHFGLVDSHRKHVLRVTGGEIRSRSALLCGLFQTGQGQMALDVLTSMSAPHPIFIVPEFKCTPRCSRIRDPGFVHAASPQHVLSRQTCKLHGVSRLR